MSNLLRMLFLVSGALAVHRQATAESAPPCDGNQAQMNVCADERYRQADAALNAAYRELMAALGDDDARLRLREAQRAWVEYRDADCLFRNGPREESGSIWPLLQLSCLEDHTRARTGMLQQLLAELHR